MDERSLFPSMNSSTSRWKTRESACPVPGVDSGADLFQRFLHMFSYHANAKKRLCKEIDVTLERALETATIFFFPGPEIPYTSVLLISSSVTSSRLVFGAYP